MCILSDTYSSQDEVLSIDSTSNGTVHYTHTHTYMHYNGKLKTCCLYCQIVLMLTKLTESAFWFQIMMWVVTYIAKAFGEDWYVSNS